MRRLACVALLAIVAGCEKPEGKDACYRVHLAPARSWNPPIERDVKAVYWYSGGHYQLVELDGSVTSVDVGGGTLVYAKCAP